MMEDHMDTLITARWITPSPTESVLREQQPKTPIVIDPRQCEMTASLNLATNKGL